LQFMGVDAFDAETAEPGQTGQPGLTVKLWTARDPRLLIADAPSHMSQKLETIA
jgi:hypothetical protein